jgi:hypothetical protein
LKLRDLGDLQKPVFPAIGCDSGGRSKVTRASSARRRLISICSAVTFDRLSAPFSLPSR